MSDILNIKTGKSILKIQKITENPTNLFQNIKKKFSKKEIEFYNNISNPKRKSEWLTVRKILNETLNEYKEIHYDKYGKPYIEDNYNISISHSKELAGIFLSESDKIGFDIEIVSEKILRISHKFMYPEEIQKIPSELKNKMILINWSAKEAIFKLYGKGNLDFKKNIEIPYFELSEKGNFKVILKPKNEKIEVYIAKYLFLKLYNNKEYLAITID